jgi:hypothetical protein
LQCCQHYHLLLPGPTHADNSESAACGQVKLVWSEIDSVFSIFSFRRKGWSLINPGAIPACALKIIKFMLGFTTRWYKYVHVSICKCLDRFWKLTSCFVWRSSLRSVIRRREVFEKPEGSSESGRTCQTHLNAHLI